MGACSSAIAGPITALSDTRSKISIAAARRSCGIAGLHFGRSDEAEKAVDYAILAAEKSQRRWANNEALAYFDDALRRLDTMPDTKPNRLRRIDAVLKQAEVKFALGHYTEHIRALEEIRGIVDETDDPRRRATWHYWTGFLHATGGRPDVAIEHCRQADEDCLGLRFRRDQRRLSESCLGAGHIWSPASFATRSRPASVPFRASRRAAIAGGRAGRSGT